MSAVMHGAGEEVAGKKRDRPSCVAVYCGAQEPRKDIFNQTAQGEKRQNK